MGGLWRSPEQNEVVDLEKNDVELFAYPTPGYTSKVENVKLTADPTNLNLTEDQKKALPAWIILEDFLYNPNNTYKKYVNWTKLGGKPGSRQRLSFDVYGTNEDGSPAVNEAPNGIHTVYLKSPAKSSARVERSSLLPYVYGGGVLFSLATSL